MPSFSSFRYSAGDWGLNRLVLILMVCTTQMFNSFGQEGPNYKTWDSIYHKAKVASYYSANLSNGYDELLLAKAYADSAKFMLEKISVRDSAYNLREESINTLFEELEIIQSISEDNINYKYPISSLLLDTRADFVTLDDAEELLVETLVEKALEQNDPFNKGLLKTNVSYVLVQTIPFDATLNQVAIDFITSNTGHYTIRPHELTEFIGLEGRLRYQKDSLNTSDWNKIFDAFGTEKIVSIVIKDQGSVIPDIYYKGVSLNKAKVNGIPELINYYEDFKVDKVESWFNAVKIFIGNIALLCLGLLIMTSVHVNSKTGRGLSLGKYRIYFFIGRSAIIETGILLLATFLATILMHRVGLLIAPDANSFYQEPGVKYWLLFQSVVPFVFSCVLSYLVMFKMPGIVINNAIGYSRIIYSSWMMQLAFLSFYNYHSQLFPGSFFNYLIIYPAISIAILSTLQGLNVNNIFKNSFNSYRVVSFVIIVFLLGFFNFFYELAGLNDFISKLHIILIPVGLFLLYNYKFFEPRNFEEDPAYIQKNGLFNPTNWYKIGLNVDEVQSRVLDYIESDDLSNNIMVIHGDSGIGKTRIMTETLALLRNQGKNVRWFQGDCNLDTEGTSAIYEPFYEAFSIHGEQIMAQEPNEKRVLPRGFFTDRSQISSLFGEVVSKASALGPIDVSNIVESVNDTSRSEEEIVAELLDYLIDKYIQNGQSKIILVFDDFHWMDAASLELLRNLFAVIKKRSKYLKFFKFIFTVKFSEGYNEESLKKQFEHVLNTSNISATRYPLERISVTDGQAFINNVLNDTQLELKVQKNVNFRFGPFLKAHLNFVISNSNSFTPGDLFGYLEVLENEGYVKLDGEIIRLIKEPNENEFGLHDSRKVLLQKNFEKLSFEHKALLESAAIIGNKFDAQLLADIWGKDLIEVLHELESLEGLYVLDMNEEDNIFTFISKTMHQVALSAANRDGNAESSRQLIVEYQKRIIKSLLNGDYNQILEKNDLEILLSASERCFKYSNIAFIKSHAPKIVLMTVKKLINSGKGMPAIEYLKRLNAQNSNYSLEDLIAISEILNLYSRTNESAEILEFSHAHGDSSFLDEIYAQATKYSSFQDQISKSPFLSISLFLMNDILNSIRSLGVSGILLKEENDPKAQTDARFNNLKLRYQTIESFLNEGIIEHPEALLNLQFLKHLIIDGDKDVLPNMLKTALTNHYWELAQVISLEIYNAGFYSPKTGLKFLFASLELFVLEDVSFDKIDSYEIKKSNIISTVKKILKIKKLNVAEVSYLVDILLCFKKFYWAKKDYPFVLDLSEIILGISNEIRLERGIIESFKYKGAALFQLGKNQESLSIYNAYFEYTIRATRDLEVLIYPMEGLLRNSLVLENFVFYERAKQELYENLIILERSVIDRELEYSLIDNKCNFSKLLETLPIELDEVENTNEEEEIDDVTRNILVIFACMSMADGVLDENEAYDLHETAIALSYSLNLPKKILLKEIMQEVSNLAEKSFDDLIPIVSVACEIIKKYKSPNYLDSVIGLCGDIVMADDFYHPNEKILMDIAREILESEKTTS